MDQKHLKMKSSSFINPNIKNNNGSGVAADQVKHSSHQQQQDPFQSLVQSMLTGANSDKADNNPKNQQLFSSSSKSNDASLSTLAAQQMQKNQHSSPSMNFTGTNKSQHTVRNDSSTWNFDAMLQQKNFTPTTTTADNDDDDDDSVDALSDFLGGSAPIESVSLSKKFDSPSNINQQSSNEHHSYHQEIYNHQNTQIKPPKLPPRRQPVPATCNNDENISNGSNSNNSSKQHNVLFDKNLSEMLRLGFHEYESRVALEMCDDCDLQSAINIVLDGSWRTKPGNIKQQTSSTKHYQIAERFLSQASGVGANVLNRARVLIQDSSKKIGNLITDSPIATSKTTTSSFSDSDQFLASTTADGNDGLIVQDDAIKRPNRKPVECSADIERNCWDLSKRANLVFKNGQYAEAEEFYSRAISLLPSLHDNLLSLYQRRAETRSKIGLLKNALQDYLEMERQCLHHLSSNDYILSAEERITFQNYLISCYSSCGLLYENLENYTRALEYHKKLLSASKAGGDVSKISKASEGVRRCNKVLLSSDKLQRQSHSPKPKPNNTASNLSKSSGNSNVPPKTSIIDDLSSILQPVIPADTNKFAAAHSSKQVEKLREKHRLKEQSENLKLHAKDEIDARLNAWKKNKENNIRALLSSLEMILWDGINWKPVKMSDLVTPSQVKIQYMKAIAKLHPDKVSIIKNFL